MKRLILLLAGVFVFAALGATASDTATGSSRPLGHVVGDFTATVVQHGAFPPYVDGTYTIQVNAFDRTIDPSISPFTPTKDKGTLTVTRPSGEVLTDPVVNVWVMDDGASAILFVASSLVFTLYDGGVPGNKIIGPPDPLQAGVAPTRDSFYYQLYYTQTHFTWGFLTSGNISISG